MKRTTTQLPEIKLVGIKCRTNNAAEMVSSTAKIASIIAKYFQQSLSEKIVHRKKSGITYCVYTDYESDFTGDYTYFIGEEVRSFDNVSEVFSTIAIPAQHYSKFTNEPGVMPDVCISMWKKIWQMKPEELGGERKYLADFEI